MTQALDDKYFDGNIPEPYQWVQATLDRFVEINYDAALDAVRLHTKELDAGHIRQQMVDIIPAQDRANLFQGWQGELSLVQRFL